MEDAHRVVESGFGNDASASFFAVFDGHGGRGVAEFLCSALDKNIETEMRENMNGSVEGSLVCAFLFSDIQSSKLPSTVGMGSTAAVLLLRNEGPERVLYAANVGDTRAVLYDRGALGVGGGDVNNNDNTSTPQVERITFDHKATDPSECKRIERMGGMITRKRVMGVLSVSRSFGDFELKKYVVARPHVTRTVLPRPPVAPSFGGNDGPLTGGFIILACDGLWDVFSDEEAGAFVRETLAKDSSKEAKQQIATKLVAQALKKGTSDNVTCLVIGL
jgi:serine/threonine protein phosphatase PrpC